ncbi:hypothetical protein PoB_002746000 [Plakobranchus ocellatus]|uniref:Uncharacterized protein n=1 Tax=Plakobranchus ocellatus TaxID=259542 RepID=A0AAV3ZYL5_9GAST|nr:hypothetical protein PoB_002746000 [Plakobranchus ocellatus]
MRGHVTAPPFPLSDRAADVRPGCKTQRIAQTLRQVADLMCAGAKERDYFKTYCWTRELLPSVWAYLCVLQPDLTSAALLDKGKRSTIT